jgi:hypothetical protein
MDEQQEEETNTIEKGRMVQSVIEKERNELILIERRQENDEYNIIKQMKRKECKE